MFNFAIVIFGGYVSKIELLCMSVLLVTGILGVRCCFKKANATTVARMIALLAPLGLVILICAMGSQALQASFNWTPDMRLSNTFAWAWGYDPYPPIGVGPVQVAMYPPLYVLLLLPATWASSPVAAFIVAGLIVAVVCGLCGLATVRVTECTENRKLMTSIWTLWGMLALSLNCESIAFALTSISPDGPSLCFGVLAVALACGVQGVPSKSRLLLSALFAWMAVWTKQTMVPLIPLVPMLLLATEGWRTARKAILISMVVGSIVSSLLICLFGPYQEIWAQLITIPRSISFRLSLIGGWGGAILDLMRAVLLPLLVLLPLSVVMVYRDGWRCSLRRAWAWMAVGALANVPMSLLGYVKVGGNFNTFAPTVGFFVVAAALAARDFYRLSMEPSNIVMNPNRKRKIDAIAMPIILFVVLTVSQLAGLKRNLVALRSLEVSPAARVYTYSISHPDEIYFPYHAVPQLMAQKVLFHHENGLQVLDDANRVLDRKSLEAHMPSRMKYIAFHQADLRIENSYVRLMLPEFSVLVEIPELPGWKVYMRAADPAER